MLPAITTGFLVACGPALWLDRRVGLILLAAAAGAGLAGSVLTPSGAAALLVFAGLAEAYRRSGPGASGWLLWLALLALAAGLYLHALPGFVGWVVLEPTEIGDGAPYEKWLSFDKTGAGVLLLALAIPASFGRDGWRVMLARAAPWLVATPLVAAAVAVASGFVAADLTPVAVFFWWAWLNLFTTCLSEEALFRGLLQGRLTEAAVRRGWSAHLAVLASALVFGLAHSPGGPALVAFATLAGVGYGYAFHVTGRIEAAMLTHFAVNALHFLVFTYPYPAT